MVKNTKGGNKGKKVARKHVKNYNDNRKLRFSLCDDEIYAIVTKACGNGWYDVLCNDKVNRKCKLRRKFSGRNKRDNFVTIRTLLLVGIREWEVTTKIDKCDCLYVYSETQHKELFSKEKDKLIPNIRYLNTSPNFEPPKESINDVGFEFSYDDNDDDDKIHNIFDKHIDDSNNDEPILSKTKNSIINNNNDDDNDDGDDTFNWEDI